MLLAYRIKNLVMEKKFSDYDRERTRYFFCENDVQMNLFNACSVFQYLIRFVLTSKRMIGGMSYVSNTSWTMFPCKLVKLG